MVITMNELVVIENNQSFTTSLAIADGTKNEHRAVMQLISKHKRRFNKFGVMTFEMYKPHSKGAGGRPIRVAMLNEAQATLLMTMMKNTPKVLDFKEALVDAFFKARDLLMTGQMGLLQKHAILTLALEDEKAVASECGRGLADWKRKRDGLQQAIESVERQLQPQLTGFEQITH